MKNLFVTLSFLTTYLTFSQTFQDSIVHQGDSIQQAYQSTMDDIFENVDLTQVPSGILYDRGLDYCQLELFNGTIADSNKAALFTFGFAYASLYTMVVDSSKTLPPPSIYRAALDSVNGQSPVIPLIGLHQTYHRIDSSAFDSSYIEIVDGKYYDILPRSGSPYLKKEFFMFVPARNTLQNAQG